MDTVHATQLKNNLGEALKRAALGPVAIMRHGRIVAYLSPPAVATARKGPGRTAQPERGWSRRDEEGVIELCVRGDFRPSRWLRAGNRRTLAGAVAMLASHEGFDRPRMLALAERLDPGMSRPDGFGRWLANAPIQATRLLPMLQARMQEPRFRSSLRRPQR